RSHGRYAIGAENFKAKLRFEEMVDEPLDELLARGQATLARDHAAFVETARKIDPASPPAAVMKKLSDDHPAAGDLIASVAHRLQFLYAPRFPTKTRKLVAVGTNVEGWAHYAEQMMVDEGFGGGDPRARLAQLQEALLRDCRYVVGIELHTRGLTVEQGARIF